MEKIHIENETTIDIDVLIETLVNDHTFVRRLALAVRDELLKTARGKLNVFGRYAGS